MLNTAGGMTLSEDKKIIIGVGTGRCGTTTFARLIGEQADATATHEKWRMPWRFNRKAIDKNLKMLHAYPTWIVSDAGFYYLPYTQYILESRPSAKFVCLKRDREDTVRSYLRKTEGRDHWRWPLLRKGGRDKRWDRCYPKFLARTKEEALGCYWDLYYGRSEELQERFPGSFRVFSMEPALNSEEEQRRLFEFLEIPEPTLLVGAVHNKRE